MSGEVVLALFGAIAAGSILAVGIRLDPSLIVSLGLASSVFSGNWENLGLPIGIDRLVIVGGIAMAVVQHVRRRDPWPRFGPVHLALVILAAYAIGSSFWVGTLTQKDDAFALLDQLGVIPFLLFATAPIVFGSHRQRMTLVAVLSATGAYLAFTGVAETIGARALVFPGYINDPTLGIHFGRARGPFLESSAFGGALFTCAAIAVLGFSLFRDRPWVRYAVGAIVVGATIAVVGTLTRQIWIASGLTVLVVLVSFARLRRFLLPVALAAVLVAGGALVLVPGLGDRADARAKNERSVWDRANSNRAAERMVESRPVLGYGWGRFSEVGDDFYVQSPNYPITSVGELHNVPLSFLAELGVLGFVGWVVTLALAASGSVLRRGPPAVSAWQISLVMIGVNWLILLNFTPFRSSFTNYVVWTWIGVVGVVVREARESRSPSPLAPDDGFDAGPSRLGREPAVAALS